MAKAAVTRLREGGLRIGHVEPEPEEERLGEEVEALKRAKGELAGRLDRATGALQASGVAAREAAAGEARLARALEEAGRRH